MIGSLVELLKSLEIPVKTSWAATIVGFLGLMLAALDVWPFAGDQEFKAILFAVVFLFGLANLMVEFGAFLNGKINHRRSVSAEKAKAKSEAEEDERQAQMNLLALRDGERDQLIFILRRGLQRFDFPIEYSLVEKKLVVPVLPGANSTLYDLTNYVWSQRDEILARHKRVREMREFPVLRYFP